MIAALLWSSAPCVGPKVARRNAQYARVTGSCGNDLVRVGPVIVRGNEMIPLPEQAEFIQVEHLKAGENPISVELV